MKEKKDLYETTIFPKLDKIKELRAEGVTMEKIADVIGVSKNSLLVYRRKYPELDAIFAEINAELIEKLKTRLVSLTEKHVVTTTKTVYDKEDNIISREVVEKEIEPNYIAINMMLKNLDREHWKDDWDRAEIAKKQLELKEKKLEEDKWG